MQGKHRPTSDRVHSAGKYRESQTLSHNDMLTGFRQAVLDGLGHAPNDINPTGRLERFSSNGKAGNTSGWYVLHLHGDYAAGAFGCWRSGIKQTWHSSSGARRLSDAEWQQLRQAILATKQQALQEQQARIARSHQQAVRSWESAQTASADHPYLQRKQVGAYGIRQQGSFLVIPLCDFDGVIHGVQTIAADGTKQFPKGTVKRGYFHLIGSSTLDCPEGVYLCEGYATGASLYEAYRLPVLVAFDAGNLLPVAKVFRHKYPQIPLTVCADNDRKTPGNPGLSKARAVISLLPHTHLIVPDFPEDAPLHLSDFNDLLLLLRQMAEKGENHE